MKLTVVLIGATALALAGCGGGQSSANVAAEPVVANTSTAPSILNPAEITDPAIALAEGNRLMDENLTEAAIAAYRRSIELNPEMAEAHFRLGVAYALLEMQMQQSGAAVPVSENSNSKTPKKSRSELAFEAAVKAYEKWLYANPKDDVADYYLGRTYAKLMKDDEAEKSFQEAVKLKPDDTEYQTELGAILVKLAEYHEAIKPLKRAIELDTANGRAHEYLEEAEAGRRRVDYVSANKNTNSSATARNTSNGNANSNTSEASNTASKPAANARPKIDADPKPKIEQKDSRPRSTSNRP